MLFMGMIMLTVGYTAVYSALHGQWEFWKYFFPAQTTTGPGATEQAAVLGVGQGTASTSQSLGTIGQGQPSAIGLLQVPTIPGVTAP